MWQDADNKIWRAEEAFGRASPRENFAQDWPPAKSAIEPLLKLVSNAYWAGAAAQKAASVSDKLADQNSSNEALENAFFKFPDAGRLRFLAVDASLRSDSAA